MKTVNDHNLKFAFFVGRVPPRPLSATFVVKAAFKLLPGSTAEFLPEDKQPEFSGDAHEGDDPAKGLRYPSDFALFKPGTDLLLAGHCQTPAGKPLNQMAVQFSVGDWSKRLVVFGDRYWKKGLLSSSMSEPQPFVSIPLNWTRSFGGPGDARNTAGRGIVESPLPDGTPVRLLPNIESLKNLVNSAGDRPNPAGFGPIDPAAPLRASKTGTYNKKWLAQRWPWLPDDFDWTFFNAAPEDQQLAGKFLRGDEQMVVEGVHPQFITYNCRLPGERMRLFVYRRYRAELQFEEVELRLDTLFADMDEEKLILVWRGLAAADSMKLKEFEEVFVVKEPLDRPLASDLKGYQALFEKRKAEIEKEDKGQFEPPKPFVLTPPAVPDLSWVAGLKAKVAALEKRVEADAKPPIDASWQKIMGAARPTAAPPPPLPPVKSMAEGDAIIKAALAKQAQADPGAMKPFSNYQPEYAAIEKEIDARVAKMPKPIPVEGEEGEAEAEEGDWTRARVQKHAKEGGKFDEQDLSGLDLSYLDLSGCSFKEAALEEARLAGCKFDGCDLSGASLTNAILTDASFRKSKLDNADLSEVTASGACFAEASIGVVEFTGGKLAGADFSGSQGKHAGFDNCDLTSAKFDGCNLRQPDFSGAALKSASFKGAQMPDAAFYEATSSDANFEGASMPRARFSEAEFTKCNFTKCQIEKGVFEDSRLAGSNFTEAALMGSAFTGARLSQAVFLLAKCENSKFDDSIATEARFVQTNLFRASFENADLAKATFWGSNCYEVEFFNSRTKDAIFKDTNLKGTKLA